MLRIKKTSSLAYMIMHPRSHAEAGDGRDEANRVTARLFAKLSNSF